jgi:methionyl-tRNA formyltransferase
MNLIRFAFFGATNYSKELLEFLIEKDFFPEVIFTIPEEFNISYSSNKVVNSNFADLGLIAKRYSIPIHEIDSTKGKRTSDYLGLLKSFDLDLILVLGWYYMIPKEVRGQAKLGAWGIHASLLPNYAGGAPLTWAIINGEEKTGVTLFRMDDGVDDGDIIAQSSFEIGFEETIKDIYKKATENSKKLLLYSMKNIKEVRFKPQNKEDILIFPQRAPEDGEIDIKKSGIDIYNFIRAQSSPYPGAYIIAGDGKKVIIDSARLPI